MRHLHRSRLAGLLLPCLALSFAWSFPKTEEAGAKTANLVRNPFFETAGKDGRTPDSYRLQGGVVWTVQRNRSELPTHVALDSGKDQASGSIAQDVRGFTAGRGKGFRFSIRGLPEDGFAVKKGGLFLKVEFYAKKGTVSLDGVTKNLDSLIEKDRRDLTVNGNYRRGGAAVWKTYALDFTLPFAEIDQLRLVVGFRNGAGKERGSAFRVAEFSLTALPEAAKQPRIVKTNKGLKPEGKGLIHLGGRWYYQLAAGESKKPNPLIVHYRNADRLFYFDGRLSNPFAENMSAWLRKGYKDLSGKVVQSDRFVPDSVTVRFEGKTMIVKTRNLPNHPTAVFPSPRGQGGNPSYIQERDDTWYLPLEPAPDPRAKAMNKSNSNRALPMGPVGFAVNGVVFYNPFDAGSRDAHDIMDRCCGHPSPDNRYHYHKYPICVKSPFVDEGEEHSPLIGWALDGFPIYGPYERKGVMAKDDKDKPLNDFNIHYDEVRGWHYHVTPGKFPYVIGGFYGQVDPRNLRRGRGPGPGPGRDRRPGGPGGFRRILERMDLTEAQRSKADKIVEATGEKVRSQREEADKDLLARMKEILTKEQYRKFERALRRPPAGGPPREE